MNKVILIGRLTKDPELKFTPGEGNSVATLTLAVDRKIKKEGQPSADFINCVAFGKTAEVMTQYLNKGKLIGISGEIRTGSYEAKDGTRRYTTDVYISEFQFLEKSNKPDAQTNQLIDELAHMRQNDDGDIPF